MNSAALVDFRFSRPPSSPPLASSRLGGANSARRPPSFGYPVTVSSFAFSPHLRFLCFLLLQSLCFPALPPPGSSSLTPEKRSKVTIQASFFLVCENLWFNVHMNPFIPAPPASTVASADFAIPVPEDLFEPDQVRDLHLPWRLAIRRLARQRRRSAHLDRQPPTRNCSRRLWRACELEARSSERGPTRNPKLGNPKLRSSPHPSRLKNATVTTGLPGSFCVWV